VELPVGHVLKQENNLIIRGIDQLADTRPAHHQFAIDGHARIGDGGSHALFATDGLVHGAGLVERHIAAAAGGILERPLHGRNQRLALACAQSRRGH
jgi:hypothetical protein